MAETPLRWNRRKDSRPGEIIDAAIDVFVEKGFAAAKLNEIAQRAGIAKGTLYRYFDTKEDIFRAAAKQAIASNLDSMEAAINKEKKLLQRCSIPAAVARDGRGPR